MLQTMLPVLNEAVDAPFKHLDFQGPWVEVGVEKKIPAFYRYSG